MKVAPILTSTAGTLLAIGIALAIMERRTLMAQVARWWERKVA